MMFESVFFLHLIESLYIHDEILSLQTRMLNKCIFILRNSWQELRVGFLLTFDLTELF